MEARVSSISRGMSAAVRPAVLTGGSTVTTIFPTNIRTFILFKLWTVVWWLRKLYYSRYWDKAFKYFKCTQINRTIFYLNFFCPLMNIVPHYRSTITLTHVKLLVAALQEVKLCKHHRQQRHLSSHSSMERSFLEPVDLPCVLPGALREHPQFDLYVWNTTLLGKSMYKASHFKSLVNRM